MTPEQWERVKRIYLAFEEGSSALSVDILAEEPEVRAEVERLLKHRTNGGNDFLERLPFAIPRQSAIDTRVFSSGELLIGRWEILDLLGRGGMGEVYRAVDRELGEHVALKTLRGHISQNQAALDRFRAEIRLARSIGHPNICNVYDVFTHRLADGEEVRFVTMEFLQGETLAARLARGALSANEALGFARQLIEGLAAAHEKGILHSDLKSNNLMLVAGTEGAERLVIMDFGLARILSGETVPGRDLPAGTPGYMAPEQWTPATLTRATDVYGLGVVLYEMRTGKRPFGEQDSSGVIERQRNGEIVDFPAQRTVFDSRWQLTILRCLNPEPARRFQNVREVLTALDPAARPFWRKPRILAVTAAAVVLGIPASFWLPHASFWERSRSIVVMPFEAADETTAAHYASGLSDELIGSLTRVSNIRVLARETAGHYGASSDPADLARQLGASLVARGKVDVHSDQVEISAQLIEPFHKRVVWAENFHRPVNEAFALFHEVGAALVTAVEPVGHESRHKPSHQPDPEAYRLYLDARYFYNYRTLDPRNGERAAERFEEAIAKDPNFAEAYSGLIDAYFVTGGPSDWTTQHLDEFLHQSAARALALDPTSPEVLGANATLLQHQDFKWSLAEQYLRRAIQIQPGNAAIHVKYGGLLSSMGRLNEAMREFDTALDLDPLSPSIRNTKAMCLFWGRRYGEAKKLIESMLQGPQAYRLFPYLGAIYLMEGKTQEGLAQYKLGVEKSRNDSLAQAHYAYGLAKVGQGAKAREILAHLVSVESQTIPFYISLVFTALHDNDVAFSWLDKAFAEHDWNLTELKTHPYLDDLRRDPRFPAYLHRMNLN